MKHGRSRNSWRPLLWILLAGSLAGSGCGGDRFASEGSGAEEPAGDAGGGGVVDGSGVGGSSGTAGDGADVGGSSGTAGDGADVAGSSGTARGGAGGSGGTARGGAGGIATSAGSAGVPGVGGAAGAPEGGPEVSDGLVLWLAADRGVTEMQGGVARWADSSGNGFDAVQSVRDERPRLVSARGDLPMLEFDGVNDGLSLADGFEDFGAGLSFFAVVEVHAMSKQCASIVQLSNGEEVDDIDFGVRQFGLVYESGEDWFYSDPNLFEPDQRIVVGMIHRANSDRIAELRLNGEYALARAAAAPAAVTRYDNFIGRTLYEPCGPFEGRIGEILLYRRALSQQERVSVEEYLKRRWPTED